MASHLGGGKETWAQPGRAHTSLGVLHCVGGKRPPHRCRTSSRTHVVSFAIPGPQYWECYSSVPGLGHEPDPHFDLLLRLRRVAAVLLGIVQNSVK